MSRILRRPMFRGGQVVDSRGTGITSGLMDGGRVGYSNGDFVSPGAKLFEKPRTYEEIIAAQNLKSTGPLVTESFIKDKFKNFRNKFLQTGEEKDEIVSPEDFNFSDMSFMLDPKNRATTDLLRENPDQAYEMFKTGKLGDIDFSKKQKEQKILAKKSGEDVDFGNTTVKNTEQQLTEDQKRIAELEKQLLEIQQDKNNEASTDITQEEIFKMLGGDKARSRDVGKELLTFAGAEGDTVSEKFQSYVRDTAKIPSETQRLKEAAATLAIKDKLADRQSDRDIKKLAAVEGVRASIKKAGNDPKNLPWQQKKAYYADVLKTGSLKSSEVIRAALMDTKSEEGKVIHPTTNDTSIVNNPENFEVGLYVVDAGEKGKLVVEILEENGVKVAKPRNEFAI